VLFRSLFPKQTQIIFTSSTGVYKESLEVVDEDSPCDENHQVRKAEISLITDFHDRLIIMRLAGLIGEKRHPINYFLNKSAIPNGLSPVNLIQLNDVINAFLAIIHSGKKAMIFNVCAPQNPSKMEYYGEIAQQKFGIQLSFIAEGKGKIIDGSKIVKETSFAYNTSIFDVRF
jgi:nucleoside-diphosphate-sugar epimerase